MSSLALQGDVSCPQGALQDVFCNGVESNDVTKTRELVSFSCRQRGFCFPEMGSTRCLTHSFVLCSVYEIRSRLLKHFVPNVCTRLSLCCQSPALASTEEDGYSKCSAEFKLGFEANVSALPDVVKS